MVQKLVADTWPEDEKLAEIAFRFGIFQRLDYLLHIPTEQMTKDNGILPECGKIHAENLAQSHEKSLSH